MSCSLPPRTTVTGTSLPTGVLATIFERSRGSFTSLPSNLTITSPDLMPAGFAGPLSATPATSAPRAFDRPRLSAIVSSTVWMFTPSQPRRVSPNFCNCSITGTTVEAGVAKPMPTEPPEGDRIAVFTPMTSPSMLNSGPPELPLLMAASVCR